MMAQQPPNLVDLADRLAELVGTCVEVVGAARGRQDAPFLLAVLTPGRLADVHGRCAQAPTGELSAALHRAGALQASQRFAPNNSGYFSTFLVTTIGMLLGDEDRDTLTVLDAAVADLARLLHQRCHWQLLLGWERAVYAAFGQALNAAHLPAGAAAQAEVATMEASR